MLRRLLRICRHYGAAPQFICTSATIANPQELAERLIGSPVGLVVENGAPAGEKVVVFYNPPVVNAELGIRRPYLKEASRLATPILRARVPTIVFTGSRLAEEVVLTDLKAAVERAPAFTDVIRGYRGGYLPNRRREVERGLRAGDVLGVVSTNALELGIDIGRLDVALLAGYPGTVASTWQQAGRAGRRTGLSAAILVASSAPLDQFIVTHPDYFFGAPPEHGLINPDNPYVLASHLKCAAFELPFAEDEPFGAEDVGRYLRLLEEEGLLHRTGGRYHWTSETYPADHLSLRSVASDNFVVIDSTHQTLEPVEAVRRLTRKREVIAEVDWRSAFAMVHPKAIYLIEGQQYEVQELRFREDEEKVAYVKRVQVDYFTDAVTAKGVWALDRFQAEATGSAAAGPGRAGRAPGRRAGGRLQEDQVRHDGERGRGRGRRCPSRRCRPRGSGSRCAPRCSPRSRRTATRSSTASGAWRTSSITWRRSSSCATCGTSAPGSATPPRPSRAARRRAARGSSPRSARGPASWPRSSSSPPSISMTASRAASGSRSASSS